MADMFVDDCDLWIEPVANASDADLVRDFATADQVWERILFASGGLLALQKC